MLLLALAACDPGSVRAGGGGARDGEPMGVTLAVQADGPWSLADLEISTSADGLGWTGATDVSVDTAPPPVDVVLVVDNSGSVEGDVDGLVEAVERFADRLHAADARHRVGLVRVSSEATLLSPPTDDPDAFTDAAGEMFLSNGWTALWDGVRTANEALDDQAEDAGVPVIVVFAAGGDNNSSDEKGTPSGDGVDTTFASLLDLWAGGVRTTVHAVELGDPPLGLSPLQQMSASTGGTHARVRELSDFGPALLDTADVLAAQARVSFLPAGCAHSHVRIEATLRVDGVDEREVATAPIPATCD